MGGCCSKPVKRNTSAEEDEVTRNTHVPPLSPQEIKMRIEASPQSSTHDFSNFSITYAFVSQRGYYPDAPDKENQDKYLVEPMFGKTQDQALFAVLDGHGKDGHDCATFARNHLEKLLEDKLSRAASSHGVKESLKSAHVVANESLHANHQIDDSLSGTTCISVLFRGRSIYVSNVGDSRAILISSSGGRLVAKALSSDQTPYRKDERERVKRCGARVLSMDQIEGLEPIHENWGTLLQGDEIDEGGDPPRIWSPLGDYPGTAFTRSIGDRYAEELGVFAEPEILEREIGTDDKYIVLASDGVFEFLTNQMVADIIGSKQDMLEACHALVAQSYDLWLQYEVRTDDITVIIIQLEGLDHQDTNKKNVGAGVVLPDVKPEGIKPVRRVMSREMRKTMIQDNAVMDDEDSPVASVVVEKTDEQKSLIEGAIRNSFLFQHLSGAQRERVISVMQRVEVATGDWVIKQGDQGDRLYIIELGKFEVRVSGVPGDLTGGNVVHVYDSSPTFHPSFGELSLMYGKPRAASVIAVTDGVLWSLDRSVFCKEVLRANSARRDILRTLRRVPTLQSLSLQQLQRLADKLTEEEHEEDSYVIRQGEQGDTFYVIMKGRCECTINDPNGGPEQVVMRLKENDYFGERALLTAAPRAANVIAVSKVRLLYIGRAVFEEVLGPLAAIIDEDRARREAMAAESIAPPDELSGVTLLGVAESDQLGQTVLGAVNSTSANVCLRVFLLEEAQTGNHTRNVLNAIDAAKMVTASGVVSPTLPHLLKCYRSLNAVYLLFNAPVVGDLTTLAKVSSVLMTEQMIAYIAASVVSALECLHGMGIVYRGVQPEMIHLDAAGRILLLDYRFCKVGGVKSRTYTICGAVDYLAPEQITRSGHSTEVDFWALGVLLAELATGEQPFASGSEVAVMSKIVISKPAASQAEDTPAIVLPESLSAELSDIILKLVVREPEKRLGSSGFEALKTHSFFSGVKWGEIHAQASPLQALAKTCLEEVLSNDISGDMRNSWERQCTGEDWLGQITN